MCVFSQLHMGKQAEEQQKFGERVSRSHPGWTQGHGPALGGLSPGGDCHAGGNGDMSVSPTMSSLSPAFVGVLSPVTLQEAAAGDGLVQSKGHLLLRLP